MLPAISQARFWVQALFLLAILVFCMIQLFRQVEDKAVYIALLSAICGNTVPTIKQKKPKAVLSNSTFLQPSKEDFDEVDSPSRPTNSIPMSVLSKK